MHYYVHIIERKCMIPAFVFSATERRMWKKESLHVHGGFSTLLQKRPATVRLSICRLFMDSIVEPFVHCHIFHFTSKSSRLVLIVDSNPESIPLCLLSVRTRACRLCSHASSSFVFLPWQPLFLSSFAGHIGVFVPADGMEPQRRFTFSLSSQFLCELWG